MRLINSDIASIPAAESRRAAFENYVKEMQARHVPGTGKVASALHNYGFQDSIGPVIYEAGTRKGNWIMPDGQNPNVLLFKNRFEAQSYGKSLMSIFPLYGFFNCQIWVDKVSVHMSFGNQYMGSLARTDIYEDDLYVLRIKVQ